MTYAPYLYSDIGATTANGLPLLILSVRLVYEDA